MNAIDLFAGCGGLSRGFMDAGYDIIVGVDNENCDKCIRAIYKEFFNYVINKENIDEMLKKWYNHLEPERQSLYIRGKSGQHRAW